MDNLTNTDNVDKLKVFYWEQVITAVLILLIAIAGIIGNSMIILAVCLSQKLHNATNAFVTSLSIVDLLTSFFLIWFAVGALGKGEWPIPQVDWICEATAFMIYACVGTSMWTLGAIAINRLINITKPYLYKQIFTSWKLCIFVAIPWIVPAGSTTVALLTGNGGVGYDKLHLIFADLDTHENAEVFNLGQMLVGLPIPLVAITISYLWIYIYVKRHFRAQKRNASYPLSTPTSPSNVNVSNERRFVRKRHPSPVDSRKDRISKQQIEITKNLFFIVCAFFCCFLPYFALQLFSSNVVVQHLVFYVKVAPHANSAINFVIYAKRHPVFKTVFGHMVRGSFADIPQPSKFLNFIISKRK